MAKMKMWVVAAITTAVLATALFLGYGYSLRREAQSVVNDVSELVSASDHDVAFAALRQKYGNRLQSVGCAARVCSYKAKVSNRVLSAVLRIPYTELNARFDLLDKSVATAMVDFRSAQSKRESPVVHIQADFCPATSRCGGHWDFFYLNPWSQSSTPEQWNGIVEMGFAAVPELRKAALSLNFNCLTNISGCTDIAQLLPLVWSPSATGVRCVVTNHEGQAH
ncbi:MAG: hypothetical protein ABSC15_23485 [Terriglobales bacterium]|jgi:hypothetical protein